MTPFLLRCVILSGIATFFVAITVRLLGKRTPNLHRLLWFEAVLLGLCVIPWTLSIPFYDAPTVSESGVSWSVGGSPARYPRETPAFTHRAPIVNANEEPSLTVQAPKENPSLTLQALMPTLAHVWLAGIAVLLLRRVYQFVRLHLRLRGLNGDAPPLWDHAGRGVPAKWGWTEDLGPALVLSWSGYRLLFPRALWDELSESQRLGIVQHEIAHYRGGDVYLCELVRLLVIPQWFNPFAWFAARKFDEATEWKCDDQACTNPKELIETLLSVHDSTESLGLYLSSFARISVMTRINRLVDFDPDTKEKHTMKSTLILLLSFALLLCGLVQIKLVARQTADDGRQTAESETEPKEHPEIEARIKLAEAMVDVPDITTERLVDMMSDLTQDSYKIQGENKSLKEKICRAQIAVCDKILALNPDPEENPDSNLVNRAMSNKLAALVDLGYLHDFADADVTALKQFVEDGQKWGKPDSYIHYLLQRAKGVAVGYQIGKLQRIEKPTLEQFEPVKNETVKFLTKERDANQYMACDTMFIAEKMQDAKTITREQLIGFYGEFIDALADKQDELDRNLHDRLVNQRAIHLLVGQKLQSIAPGPTNGKAEVPALFVASKTENGAVEMRDMLRFDKEYADKGLKIWAYFPVQESLQGTGRNDAGMWIAAIKYYLDFPKICFSEYSNFQMNDIDMRIVADQFSGYEYKPWNKTFLLIDVNGIIVEFGTADAIREKLVAMFGPPDAAKIAEGEKRVKEFDNLPKPCASNMRSIMIGMHQYHDTYGSFPPAYTVDAKGNKLHSWRTLLLPFLEQKALYNEIRLDEPWNSEHNKRIANTIVPVYQCDEFAFEENRKPITTYCVVVGGDAMFSENGKTTTLSDITDGTSNTIALVERATPIPWMQPDDVSFDEACRGVGVSPNGISGVHEFGSNIAIGDGSTRFLPKSVEPKVLRAILTKGGGESYPLP